MKNKLFSFFFLYLFLCSFNAEATISVSGRQVKVSGINDLKGGELVLPKGASLIFARRASLKNGTVVGDDSSVIAARSNKVVFADITLSGTWEGYVSDLMFDSSGSNYTVVANMFKFNKLDFFRQEYFIEKWTPIIMNPKDVIVDGHGVVFHITANKGKSSNTSWGRKYDYSALFFSDSEPGASLSISNINIDDVFDGTKWGERTDAPTPVLYFYFYPCHDSVHLVNVNSDGCGGLLGQYNVKHTQSSIIVEGCTVKTSQFAIELGNRVSSNSSGTTEYVKINGNNIYRYPNSVFVGPISIVGQDHQLKMSEISGNVFYESNAGNIELSGVDKALFIDNDCNNLFCYSGDIVPKEYTIQGNVFKIRSIPEEGRATSFKVAGETIRMVGNTFTITSRNHPFIELLNPELVCTLDLEDNTIEYYPIDGSSEDSNHTLFAFKPIKGSFSMRGTKFSTTEKTPRIINRIPSGTFENPFPDSIINMIYK